MKFKRTACVCLAVCILLSCGTTTAYAFQVDENLIEQDFLDNKQTITYQELNNESKQELDAGLSDIWQPGADEEHEEGTDEPLPIPPVDRTEEVEETEEREEIEETKEIEEVAETEDAEGMEKTDETDETDEVDELPSEIEITLDSKDKGASIFQLLKRAGYDADSAKHITSIKLNAPEGLDDESTIEISFSAVTKAVNSMPKDENNPSLVMWCPDLENFEADIHLTLKNNKLSARVFGDPNGNVVMQNLKMFKMPSIADVSAAFANCTKLETVELGGVTTIGAFSFQNCTSLKSITFRNLGEIPYFVESDDDPEGSHFDGVDQSVVSIYVPDNKVFLFYGTDEQGNQAVVADGFETFAQITGYGENYYDESDLPDPTQEITISTFDSGSFEAALKTSLGLTNKSTPAEISAAYASIKTLKITGGTLIKDDCTFINNKLKKLEELWITDDADFGAKSGKNVVVTHSIPSAAFRSNKTLKYFQADNG